jgi:hypothetical protein
MHYITRQREDPAMFRHAFRVPVCALFLCLFASTAPQAQEAWERIAVLGINTRAVGFGGSYTFAGTARGVWRSDDQGVTWEQSRDSATLAQSVVADLVVSPRFSGDGTVFAITQDGRVWRSTNAGSTSGFTFSQIKGPGQDKSPGTSLAIHPDYNNPSGSNRLLFVGYLGDGLDYTADAGAATPTWSTGGGPIHNIYDLAISPDYSNTGLLLMGGESNDGPLWMRNSTGNWSNKSTGVGEGVTETVTALLWPKDTATGHQLAFAGTIDHGMYKATNLTWSGGTWSAACDGTCSGTGCTGTLARVNAMARATASAAKFIEGRQDGAFLSTNDGGACSAMDLSATIQAVEFQPGYNGVSDCYVFFGTPHGLFRKVVGSCTPAPAKRGPEIVDGFAVALAGDGAGQFMGSLSEGLFKCVSQVSDDRHAMVRYNNFPNGQIPQVVAVALNPSYNETYVYGTGDECGERPQSELFVGVNFPTSPSDNGVYRSEDFGNTWTRLSTNWPSSTIPAAVYDLAMSPDFLNDAKLYVATSAGLYRWDGGTAGWQSKYSSPVYTIGLPPNFSYSGGTGKVSTLFISTDNGTLNQVYSCTLGGDGTWSNRNYSGTGSPPPPARGRVTGFAFPAAYNPSSTAGVLNNVFVSATTAPSTQTGVAGGIYRFYYNSGWTWEAKGPGSGAAEYSWDIAAEPAFNSTNRDLLIATNEGVFKTEDAGSNWSQRRDGAAYAVTYDRTDTGGDLCMAGFQGTVLSGIFSSGSALSGTGGDSWPTTKAHTGYHYLPDDVWASVAHERDPDILFSSSPSMGVFVSEDKGISFRPWNRGFGGTAGPCSLRTGLGINMLADRRGSNRDIVWAGTAEEGIKARYIYYDTSTTPATIDLETSDGVDANGWLHNTWTGTGTAITGRWERIEVTPNTGQTYPVWATGQGWGSNSAQGMAVLPSGAWWSVWRTQNSGLPASLDTRGVRQGYQSLQSGVTLPGESVPYHQWNYYTFQVPTGTGDARFVMDDLDDLGSLDPDMYIRYGAQPTLDLYDYRPWINGDELVCVKPTSIRLDEDFLLFSEDFASGIPGAWTIVDGGSGGGTAATWTTANPGTRSIGTPISSPFAIVDSDFAQSAATQDEQLITPTINASNYGQVVLVFDNQFYRYSSGLNEICDVDVSTNGGGSWTNVLRMQGASDPPPPAVNTKVVDISSVAAGQSSVKIRFHYYNAQYEYWWAIDNVRVYGTWPVKHDGSGAIPSATWTTTNPCGRSIGTPFSEPFAIVDTGCVAAGTTFYELLYTPIVDCSAYSKVTLTFDHRFNRVAGGGNAYLYVSDDGGYGWTYLGSLASNVAPSTQTVDLSTWAGGKANVKVRFYYADAGTTLGSWWAIDNVKITGEGPRPGTWHVGIYGYSGTNSTYNLTATRNSGCTPLIAPPPGDGKRDERTESGTEEGLPQPEAPSTATTWGTISGSGVYKGTGAASAIPGPGAVTWTPCGHQVTNTLANTVVQLSDLTLIAGCNGNVYYSPGPDECSSTWVDATSNVASAASNDFRDLLVCSNGDVLIAANGTGAGTAAGGVWLSGDKGAHWMRLSQGFDSSSQELTDLMADAGNPPSYYSSTGATGEYARTITADAYPTVTSVTPTGGSSSGGTTVTVAGTGFLGTCPTGTAADCPSPNDSPAVLFGETPVTPTTWSATSITCTSPAGAMGAVNVTVRNPDTRRSTTGPTFTYTCSAPSTFTFTATDASAYHFNGITLTWTPGPTAWGDGASTSRSYSTYRDGYLTGTYASGITTRTDNLATKVTSHTFLIRATNSCGLTTDETDTAADDAEAGGQTSSALKWHTGGKTQLGWGSVTGSTTYTVYRGSGSSVANLATGGGASVCVAYSGSTANTGATLSSTPSSGQFYWYLVTASASANEGTLGSNSSGGARKVSSSGACASP